MDERNTGHGWVYPRPDGMKARCGGPAMCSTCAADATRKTVYEAASERQGAAQNELIALLKLPGVCRPEAVHTYECRYWREGKSHGPCTCGARDLDTRIRAALIAAGVEVGESPNQIAERNALSARPSSEGK